MKTSPSRHRSGCGRHDHEDELDRLRRANARLKSALERSRAETDDLALELDETRATLRATRAELRQVRSQAEAAGAEAERLRVEANSLRAKLEEARRANKRQAAPFSRDKRKPDAERKRPGRRSGPDHGRHNHRRPPARPDKKINVALPEVCPHCGGDNLVTDRWAIQHQDELLTAIVSRRYRIAVGHCPDCDGSVRGRHPDQTSQAVGAAGTMLGPKAVALAAWLRHGCGLPAAKIARLYANLGLSVTPSGLTRAIQNLATDASGTYDALIKALRLSPVVSPDETGWRIDGERAWLWVFVGERVTVYSIAIRTSFRAPLTTEGVASDLELGASGMGASVLLVVELTAVPLEGDRLRQRRPRTCWPRHHRRPLVLTGRPGRGAARPCVNRGRPADNDQPAPAVGASDPTASLPGLRLAGSR